MDEPQPDWDHVISQVKRGNEGAAKDLVEALYPKLIKIVRGHIPKSVDEQDVMQDIYLKVFTKIDQYAGPQPFDHWAAKIALNTCFDRLRKHKTRRELRHADLSAEEVDYLERASTAEDAAGPDTDSAVEIVGRLVETLKPREQVVIRLLDLEEKTVAEICNLTGWGASKIKVTAHRARKKLAEAFKRLEKPSFT